MAVVPDKYSHPVLCSLHCFSINSSYLQMLQNIKSSFLKDNIKFKQGDSDPHSGSRQDKINNKRDWEKTFLKTDTAWKN